jgi:putative tryptophan/tyrosine transport system substrate-binding protein
MAIHIRRREFIFALGGAVSMWPLAARAQHQPAMPVIGVMSPLSAATAARNLAALRNGLRDLGYIEGQNIKIEYRFADGNPERFTALLSELVGLKPVVILVGSNAAVMAAVKLTQTIPLIAFTSSDTPAAIGKITSLAHPGGNLTGFLTEADPAIVAKRVELLREVAPGFSRVGAFVIPEEATVDGTTVGLQSAAGALGLDIHIVGVRSAAELEGAFTQVVSDNMQALYVSQSALFLARRTEFVARVAGVGMPPIYPFREYVQAGGLLSYGASLPDMYRRATVYIDKILKGERPGELPLQAVEKYELVVNLRAGKALGLPISEGFLLRADEVIE